MEICRAQAKDMKQILKYDRHIPESRLAACIDSGWVDVLRCGGEIVGVLRYNLFWQTIPFLDLLYIDEAHRGVGWGSRMMAAWEADMKAAGYSCVMLSTQEDETAFVFYQKIGYRRIGAFLPPEQEADEVIYLKGVSL